MRATSQQLSTPRQTPWQVGTPWIWLLGAGLVVLLLMVFWLVGLLFIRGTLAFWPGDLWAIRTQDGRVYLGEIRRQEPIPGRAGAQRLQLRVGNRDLYGIDFLWVEREQIAQMARIRDAVFVERREWGPFIGFVDAVRTPSFSVQGPEAWPELGRQLEAAHRRYRAITGVEKRQIGDVNYELERLRLRIRRAQLRGEQEALQNRLRPALERLQARYSALAAEAARLRAEDARYTVTLRTVDGRERTLPISAIVRAYTPNDLDLWGKARVYTDRLWEFLSSEPRESNTEGGVLPAIFGTVMMTLLMSLLVVPFGVLTALYIHEYARQGWAISAVRIAVNNLAGVPSIVFGIFGLGFFVYFVGGHIDRLLYPERLPTPTFGTGGILWASLTLALLTVPVVIVATEEALAAVPQSLREASLALGATKWQTVWRVVLPGASPGILTGMILAVARGAGEVAPLMLVGVVKLAPELPFDHHPPFFHLERKFMHLGFHIYDVGFQSPNVEAAVPMVFATALLLVLVVLILNLTAIRIRNQLRRRYRFG
ncbi:MAG: phosphate ABC transporter permease PstA [Bacteroidetes bacterium]|nr:phosphate ABC transporter permease PstA [Rhodothermia bacterium]MCS7155628.1 phosphate ABC transporter permease PstA [Bacteroidota bacterium]MCX7906487.1 phosphate ABC transporter permease PstA [Bacteroidota bacterium]MDW8137232.1 phosphate ABC transporter permease PstA [Bacteroidota bacterium]MDW8284898.1 phosphate ABC transporter permease PstA [Bacteroidota bacterium]